MRNACNLITDDLTNFIHKQKHLVFPQGVYLVTNLVSN